MRKKVSFYSLMWPGCRWSWIWFRILTMQALGLIRERYLRLTGLYWVPSVFSAGNAPLDAGFVEGDYWAIKIKDTGNKRFLKCCRWYSSRLLFCDLCMASSMAWAVCFWQVDEYVWRENTDFGKGGSVSISHKMFVCGFGGVYILKYSGHFSGEWVGNGFPWFLEEKIWIRPLVILADNDKGFRDYLEKRLSECFVVRSFDDGQKHWR